MEYRDVLCQRRSVRHFGPEIPSRPLLQEILDEAAWAPSGGNSQPWRTVVLGPGPARAYLERHQQAALDIMLPPIRMALESESAGADSSAVLDERALRFVNEELNLLRAPPAWLVFVYIRRPSLGDRLAAIRTCVALLPRAAAEKKGLWGKIRYVLRLARLFPRLLAVDRTVQDAGLSNFMYALTLSAHDRGLASCILSMFAIDQAAVKAHFKLGGRDEVLAAVALGSPPADGGSRDKSATRRPVQAEWRE